MSEDLRESGVEEEYQEAADINEEPEYTEPQARTVPLEALEAERVKRQRLEEENRLIRENLELMKASQSRNTAVPKRQEEADSLDEDDILTVKEYNKRTNKMADQLKTTLKELQMAQRNPDYQEVISKYLPEVIKSNPGLHHTLQQTQDYELAYYLAKNSEGYRNAQMPAKINPDAERILKNSQLSGGLSSVGASTPVSQAKRYKEMSDQEFMMLMQKNRS